MVDSNAQSHQAVTSTLLYTATKLKFKAKLIIHLQVPEIHLRYILALCETATAFLDIQAPTQ